MPRLLSRSLVSILVVPILSAGALLRADNVVVDKLNKKIDNITLHDAAGKARSLYDLKDKKAIVVVFLSFECPVSTGYSSVLAELAKTYRDKQVAFVAVNSSDDGDAAHLVKQAAEYKLPFPVFKDEQFRAADAFKADTVPSAFVLDHNFVLRYRGRIDNGYYARLKKNSRITRHDLRQALDEVLDGKAVSKPATKPIGCAIVRAANGRRQPAGGRVTFYRDVLPIVQKNCQECHRPGAVGPFALMTYKQAVNWADDIKEYVQERKMPPWKPVEGPAYQGERKMAEKDIETLLAWVDGGRPEGDPKDAPPPRRFVEGWQLGQPDLVLTVPDEMTVGASGPDLFRCFVLPTNLTEDKFVTAVEVRPGNSRIVHHTLNYFDTSGTGRKLEKKESEKAAKRSQAEPGNESDDRGPGYTAAMGLGFRPGAGQVGGLGGWAPGNLSHHLPDGYGYFLPKGSDIIIQVHYHRNGRVEKDRTTIGLYFAKNGQTKRWKNIVLPGRFLFIPAGNDRFRVQGELEVLQECTLYSVMPHMHMLGREIKVTLTPPNGKATTLTAIKDWEYNWQETYFFKQPIAVKPGTRLSVEAFYDNSKKNPNNPFSPPRLVKFGEQTTDEMCYVFFGATSEKPGGIKVRREGQRDKPRTETPKSFQVPYRTTNAKHILVRAKINGKGPYNFIVDTGAPALFVAVPVAHKLGIKADDKDWGVFDRFEIEGGVVLNKVKGRIETPPQIEGMNALGLAGVKLHGMIGYDILARYRMEIDFTRDKMVWTPLDYKPKASMSLGGGRGGGGLDLLGSLLKSLGSMLGTQAAPPLRFRGFLGVELKDGGENPTVQTVLADGPAGKAGVKGGDRITHIQGRAVFDISDVQRYVGRKKPGEEIMLTVKRGNDSLDITVKLGEGL